MIDGDVEFGSMMAGQSVGMVAAEKRQIIRKNGLLEYYEHREEFTDVGGMEILKESPEQFRARIRAGFERYGQVWCPHTAAAAEACKVRSGSGVWPMPALTLPSDSFRVGCRKLLVRGRFSAV